MTWTVEVFRPEHLVALDVQAAQPELAIGDVPGRMLKGAALAVTGRCFTVCERNTGRPVFCGGALSSHAHYTTLWAAFARDAGSAMLAIERRTRRFIDTLDECRVDTVVRAGFSAGERWVERLGFVREGAMPDFFEDGGTAVIYRLRRR